VDSSRQLRATDYTEAHDGSIKPQALRRVTCAVYTRIREPVYDLPRSLIHRVACVRVYATSRPRLFRGVPRDHSIAFRTYDRAQAVPAIINRIHDVCACACTIANLAVLNRDSRLAANCATEYSTSRAMHSDLL